jgi:hypothetical protein
MVLLQMNFKISLLRVRLMACGVTEELDPVVLGFVAKPSISVFEKVIRETAVWIRTNIRLQIVQNVLPRRGD